MTVSLPTPTRSAISWTSVPRIVFSAELRITTFCTFCSSTRHPHPTALAVHRLPLGADSEPTTTASSGSWLTRAQSEDEASSASESRLATPRESRLATCLARLAPSPRIRSHPVAVGRFAGPLVREALKRSDSMREAASRCKGVHRAARRSGAPDETRTHDIQLGKLSVYHVKCWTAKDLRRRGKRIASWVETTCDRSLRFPA